MPSWERAEGVFALQTSAVSTSPIAQPLHARGLCLRGIYFLVVAFLTDEAKEGDLQRSQSSWHTEFIPGPSLDVLWGEKVSFCSGARSWEGDAFLALLLRCGRWLRRGRRAKPEGLSWQDSALSILAGFQGFYLLQLGKTLRSPNSCLMGK